MSTTLSVLVVDDDPVSRELLGHFVDQHAGLELAGSCESAIEATNRLRNLDVDLVFLDVEMPDMSGLEWLTTRPNLPNVVMVSSHREYAVDAFEVDVVDYLLKPVSYARFLKAVDRVLHKSSDPIVDPDDHVFLKSKGRLVRLDLVDVHYVEAQADYVLVHTAKERHLVHGTMKSFEDKLPDKDFVRVHRSFIVRQDKIDDIEESSLVVGRDVIPIGPSYRDKVLKRLPKL